jgi:hypothetical protein
MSSGATTARAADLDAKVRRDLRTLAKFITFYCERRHAGVEKQPARLRTIDVTSVCGRAVPLCAPCAKLLAHAFMKRLVCPLAPKPTCRQCPQHCYAPAYRAQIREVMRFTGPRLVLRGRLDYLVHLWL